MHTHARLRAIITADPLRMRVLDLVKALALPDCWVAAGFVRSAVWDHLHGRDSSPLPADIDVIWSDPDRPDKASDTHRTRVVTGTSVSVRVDPGGRCIIQKQK